MSDFGQTSLSAYFDAQFFEESFAVWRAIAQLFGESEKTSLCVPVGRNGTDLLQALDVQFDGLPAVEDFLDDIGRKGLVTNLEGVRRADRIS